ncbi:hypothetical protein ACLKQF_03325 [Aeromonas salmonicida]
MLTRHATIVIIKINLGGRMLKKICQLFKGLMFILVKYWRKFIVGSVALAFAFCAYSYYDQNSPKDEASLPDNSMFFVGGPFGLMMGVSEKWFEDKVMLYPNSSTIFLLKEAPLPDSWLDYAFLTLTNKDGLCKFLAIGGDKISDPEQLRKAYFVLENNLDKKYGKHSRYMNFKSEGDTPLDDMYSSWNKTVFRDLPNDLVEVNLLMSSAKGYTDNSTKNKKYDGLMIEYTFENNQNCYQLLITTI